MGTNEENVIEKIEHDELYQSILHPTSRTILNHSLTITEQVKKLGEGIELLSNELHRQILEKHDDLLQQANHANKLESVLNTMNVHVQNLMANADRLRSQITVPYNELEKHSKVLSRLHLAGHILRQVNRLQQLSKRLATTNDPVQKAFILQDLDQLASDPDLIDIDAATTELRNIRTHQQKVIKLATGSLNQGILTENSVQTTTALQIFLNLGTIKLTTDSTVEHSVYECRESLKIAFEISTSGTSVKSKVSTSHLGLVSSLGFRNKVWNELEKVFSEDIYQICKQVQFLQNSMNELNLQNDSTVALNFWTEFGQMLQEEIKNSSSAIQQMLEEDYPKLLKLYCELVKKLKCDEFKYDSTVLKNLENTFLSTSLTKLLDPVQSMFSGESPVPSHDQVDSLIRAITGELSVSLIEEHLSEQISKNVAKSIKMFAVKTEQQLETGSEAAQVIGGTANTGQQRNVHLANALYYLETQIQRMLSNMKDSLPQSCFKIIKESLKNLENLVAAIMQPLIISVNSVIETIIITIHQESDWAKLPVPANKNYHTCSPYMRELTHFIGRVYQSYLENFENKEVLSAKCKDIAIRTIDLFVRHSTLVRPISQGGRLRLQSDYNYLENGLKQICPQLSDLGRPYRLLKSMAILIVLAPSEIVSGHASGSSVPHSTVLFMLFAFAGPDLASPHQNTAWSLPKLSAWLDEHLNEADRLDLIAGALQKYEALIRNKGSTSYDPVYPIMSQFLESTLKK